MARGKWGKYFTLAFLFCCLFLLTNCAHTVSVPLKPNFEENLTKENTLSTIRPSITFLKGNFVDERADKSKLTTFKQQVHTYDLFPERPVDEVIFDGMQSLISNSGHMFNISGPANVRVDITLLNIQAARNTEMFEVTASSKIQLKIDFIDPESNYLIYTDIYNGTDDRGRAMVGTIDMVFESIDAAIINCINNVGKDGNLASALKKYNSTS